MGATEVWNSLQKDKVDAKCPACDRKGQRVLSTGYFQCPRCGLGWRAQEATKSRSEHLFKSKAYETDGSRAPDEPGERDHKKRLMQVVLQGVMMIGGDDLPKKVFEIGCGNGHMLEGASEVGWEVAGCDISEKATGKCKAKGMNVLRFAFGDQKEDTLPKGLPNGLVGAVIAWDALEHVPDLLLAFRQAHGILAKGGLLVMHSPEFRRYWFQANHCFYEPTHLWHMTSEAACRIAEKTGFQVELTELGATFNERGYAHPDEFVAWFKKS